MGGGPKICANTAPPPMLQFTHEEAVPSHLHLEHSECDTRLLVVLVLYNRQDRFRKATKDELLCGDTSAG